MKKIILLLLMCLLASVFAACGRVLLPSADVRMEANYPHKVVKIINIMRAVLDDGVLEPGEGSAWDMDKYAFVKNVYSSEVLDPKSGAFDENRNRTFSTSGVSIGIEEDKLTRLNSGE